MVKIGVSSMKATILFILAVTIEGGRGGESLIGVVIAQCLYRPLLNREASTVCSSTLELRNHLSKQKIIHAIEFLPGSALLMIYLWKMH